MKASEEASGEARKRETSSVAASREIRERDRDRER